MILELAACCELLFNEVFEILQYNGAKGYWCSILFNSSLIKSFGLSWNAHRFTQSTRCGKEPQMFQIPVLSFQHDSLEIQSRAHFGTSSFTPASILYYITTALCILTVKVKSEYKAINYHSNLAVLNLPRFVFSFSSVVVKTVLISRYVEFNRITSMATSNDKTPCHFFASFALTSCWWFCLLIHL